MKSFPTELEGVFILKPDIHQDVRGEFVKTYHKELFEACGILFQPKEEFFSVSRKNVLRGMHFQLPPAAHAKLVYCPVGRVLDVVLDLRKSSKTCGRCIMQELSAKNHEMLYIPVGCAHGFLSMEDNSMMVYQAGTVYSPAHDAGVLWNSFGFAWPVKSPILSERDQKFPALQIFHSPF